MRDISEYRVRIERFLGVGLDTIPVVVQKKGLFWWEPACCWIDDQLLKNGRRVVHASIQIHPSLFSARRSSWRLSPEVALLHEYVHALRAPLNSCKYEEYVAYSISMKAAKSRLDRFRCWLGPLFLSPKELFFFIIAYFISMSAACLYAEPEHLWILLIAVWGCLFAPFGARLMIRWRKLLKAEGAISESSSDGAIRRGLFLTDADIDRSSL